MRDVTKIGTYAPHLFAKARLERPQIRKQHAKQGHAFTVQPDDETKPLYLVTVVERGNRILADCVEAVSGERCRGFVSGNGCYHLTTILIHLKLCLQPVQGQSAKQAAATP